MKKLLTKSIFLGAMLMLLIFPTAVGAASGTAGIHENHSNHVHAHLHAHDGVKDSERLNNVVEPYEVPCDYWPDSRHRFNTGKSRIEERYVRTHRHVEGNIVKENCRIYDVYRITELYCACGYTKDQETFVEQIHKW